jgi:hypothetical protein
MTALKRLFAWIAGQPGSKSRMTYADAEYLNLSAADTRLPSQSGRSVFRPWSKYINARETKRLGRCAAASHHK